MTDANEQAKAVVNSWRQGLTVLDELERKIALAITEAKRETWEEAANDLSHGLPLIWKKALIERCLFKAQLPLLADAGGEKE